MLGNYTPRQCGLATFTSHLHEALSREFLDVDFFVLAMNDPGSHYAYPSQVRFELPEADLSAYQWASARLNADSIDVLSVQHEYGIFGGKAGGYLLSLLRDLQIPIVTTLHTILRKPDSDQLAVMNELTQLSQRVVVMSSHGAEILKEVHGVPEKKIDFIPHGIPDIPFYHQNKERLGVKGKNLLLTFGLLAPDKGIEYVIDALPSVLAEFPETIYLVLGATHPHLRERQGETYRQMLQERAENLGVAAHVILDNRFVSQEELNEVLGAADIYITPYLKEEQITSGTLAYAVGCGKAVISTPYLYAKELLADGRGILVPWRNPEAIARELMGLLGDEDKRLRMRARAAAHGRTMTWPTVAQSYQASFEQARREFASGLRTRLLDRTPVAPIPEWSISKPEPRLLEGMQAATPLDGLERTQATNARGNLVPLNSIPSRKALAFALRQASKPLTVAEQNAEQTFDKRDLVLANLGPDTPEPTLGIVAKSSRMLNLLEMAQRVSKDDVTILISGESGAGKEQSARFVHEQSTHASGPFITVDSGAIRETLFASERFGHARGAFTGTTHEHPGLFVTANYGTLLLDEVGMSREPCK